MPMNLLAKVLYPRLPAWQARRQARQLLAAFVVAVLFGLVIMAVMLSQHPGR